MKKGIGFYVLIFLVTALFIAVGYLVMTSSESGKIPATLFSEIGYGVVILFAMVLWPDKEEKPDYESRERKYIKELETDLIKLEADKKRQFFEINNLECHLKCKEIEIKRLKNPPPPAKFKVGDRAGNLIIKYVDDKFYSCIDANGNVLGSFREEDIELMMKLNPEVK